jgi:hypothetical protein
VPLVVVSRGNGGFALNLYDIAETLADAGFVVAGIKHPGDATLARIASGAVAHPGIGRSGKVERVGYYCCDLSRTSCGVIDTICAYFGTK